MGGTVHAHGRRRWARLTVLMLAVVGVLVVTAPTALAFEPLDPECAGTFEHGDATITATCYSCHGVATPVEPIAPVDTNKCLNCHYGGYENRPVESGFGTCWSCHVPGEKKDDVQTSDGCAAATDCHAVDAAINLPHYGSSTKGCVDGCHRTSSQSVPNGSAHHDDGLPGCYDCHDGALAPEKVHEPYASPRDLISGGHVCQLCHVGYATTHPDPATIVHRTMTLTPTTRTITYGAGYTATATLLNENGTPFANASVWFRGKPILALDYINLASGLTSVTSLAGTYAFPTEYPTSITAYRAYVKGLAATLTSGPMKPVLAESYVKVQPGLTAGLSTTSLLLGKTVKVTSKIKPARPLGTVKFTIQKYVLGRWKTVATKTVAFAALEYTTASYIYKPGSRGTWRIRASVVATTELIARTVTSKTFVVK